MISALALLLVQGQLYWTSASPQANTATLGLITRPIRKFASSQYSYPQTNN